MEWIKIEDRVPTNNEYVLLLNIGYVPFIGSYDKEKNNFRCLDDGCNYTPSHWMPLPEQPMA